VNTIGKRMKSSISFLSRSWSKSNHNSTNFVFSDWCPQSRMSLLGFGRTEHHHLPWCFIKCMTILVLSLWLKSCPQGLVSCHQKSFHKLISTNRVNAHIVSPSVTTYLLCRPLSPNLESCYMIHNAIPFMDDSLFVGFNLFKFLIKDRQSYPAELHHRAIVGCYR
jgi:hypothetical protein